MRIFCLQSGLFRARLNTRWSMGFTPSSPSLRTHPKGCHVAGEVGLGAGWQLAGIGTCFSHTSLQHPLSGPQPPRLCGGEPASVTVCYCVAPGFRPASWGSRCLASESCGPQPGDHRMGF